MVCARFLCVVMATLLSQAVCQDPDTWSGPTPTTYAPMSCGRLITDANEGTGSIILIKPERNDTGNIPYCYFPYNYDYCLTVDHTQAGVINSNGDVVLNNGNIIGTGLYCGTEVTNYYEPGTVLSVIQHTSSDGGFYKPCVNNICTYGVSVLALPDGTNGSATGDGDANGSSGGATSNGVPGTDCQCTARNGTDSVVCTCKCPGQCNN